MSPSLHVGCLPKKITRFFLCSAVLLLCAHAVQAQITVSPATLSFGIPRDGRHSAL